MKDELVNARTGKPSSSMSEELIEKSEYENRQHPEPEKKMTFREKAKKFHDQTINSMVDVASNAYRDQRGYKEHR